MAVRFSSIHAALGVTGALDHAMVTQAIAEGVLEDDHLDWKRELPSDGDEAAKDIAALANSRGGILVHGVAEDRVTSAAAKAMPVKLGDPQQRRIRSWLGTRIQPMVAGIEFVALPASAGETEGFLVIVVPESPDAPHAVRKGDALGFPYRVGTQTQWMNEWNLERAYRDRFARRESDEARLAELIRNVEDQIDLAGGWLVGSTRQIVPVPSTIPRPDRNTIVKIIDDAREIGAKIAPVSNRRAKIIENLGQDLLNPRVGLRSWIVATRGVHSPSSLSDGVHLELHDDGSIVFAVSIDGYHNIENKHSIVDFLLAGFAVDFVALVQSSAQATGFAGQTLVRVDLCRSDQLPYAFVALERGVSLAQPHWTRDVRRFIPVATVAPRTDEPTQTREIVESIAADVSSQFGYPGHQIQW